MSKAAQTLLAQQNKRILVVGDLMLDAYTEGSVERISPEAPVPVLNYKKSWVRLGGAANVAINLKALGAQPILIAVHGADEAAQQLKTLLLEGGLTIEGLFEDPSRPTTLKQRFLSGSHQLLRLDKESTEGLSKETKAIFIEKVKSLISSADAVLFEDYDKGLLDAESIQAIISEAKALSIPVTVDPKKANFSAYVGATLFKPNLKEIREGLKIEVNPKDKSSIEAAVLELKEKLALEGVLLTLSENGMYLNFRGEELQEPAHLRHIADVSGAGDTVIAVATLALVSKLSNKEILALANLSGGLVCEEVGVVPISPERLLKEAMRIGL